MHAQGNFTIEPFAFKAEFDETAYENDTAEWIGEIWQAESTGIGSAGLSGATVACPRGLICLDHFHIVKQPDPRNPGRFIVGLQARLEPRNMNPGFVDTSDNLITDRSGSGLQTCLNRLLTSQFSNYLSRDSIQKKSASKKDRLRVGLVDLTGPKLTRPDLAGWGSTGAMYGASVPKILALYAAYQLRRDLRNLAIGSGKTLESTAIQKWRGKGLRSGFPNLVWLFDIRNWSGNPHTLNFTPAARKDFQNIMHNAEAGELIMKVGFPYIASVTWQSGLHHPKRGGLWLTSAYGKGTWGGNPIASVSSANVTALSAATYFTLLAQGRLVDDASSNEIKAWLANGCFTGLFPADMGLVSSKCGIWSDYLHDCAFMTRRNLRYVVVGLTRTNRSEYPKYNQLFRELDKLIVANNLTPRPAC